VVGFGRHVGDEIGRGKAAKAGRMIRARPPATSSWTWSPNRVPRFPDGIGVAWRSVVLIGIMLAGVTTELISALADRAL
jgi:hypothetical protein